MVRILYSQSQDGLIPDSIRRVDTSATEAADTCRDVIENVRTRVTKPFSITRVNSTRLI
ncbi:MAG: hypothetical protein R3E58_18635 [Phycisphaerae bacterium]